MAKSATEAAGTEGWDSVNEAWVMMWGGNALAIEADEVGIIPGLGRHQLRVPIAVRPTNESAYGQALTFAGTLSASGLRGGIAGYLGHFHHTTPRVLLANGKIEESLLVDLDLAQIDAIERGRDGEFRIDLQLEVFAGSGEHGTTGIVGHSVARDTWLRILEQIKYRRTILVELTAPDPNVTPRFSKAVDFFSDAQRRFQEGENRLAVESLRQALAAITGQDPTQEEAPGSVQEDLGQARKQEVGYEERIELARRAMKLLTDLASHPEVAETRPREARAALAMVGGLLQWYTSE